MIAQKRLDGSIICPRCNGKGGYLEYYSEDEHNYVKCRKCKGTGKIPSQDQKESVEG